MVASPEIVETPRPLALGEMERVEEQARHVCDDRGVDGVCANRASSPISSCPTAMSHTDTQLNANICRKPCT